MRFISLRITREGNPEARDGFRLHKEPYLHILVGAPNRAQKFTRVSLGKSLVGNRSDKEEILSGSFLRTRDKGTLLIVEEQPDPQIRAAVLLHADPGFRGISLIEVPREVLASGEIWEPPPTKRRPPPGTFTESPAFGVGHVVLALVHPGDRIKITRTGRLYDAPEELMVDFGADLKITVLSPKDQENEIATEENGQPV